MFFVNGATFASWSPRLPELQDNLGISDAALGLTLLGSGVGGLIASSFSGWLVDRRGSRTMTVLTSAALSLALPWLAFAPTARIAFVTLVVLGALDGLTDVSMNSQAVELQRRVGTSIITRFHALWSAGAVTGGIVASRAAAAGISLRSQLLATTVVLVAATLVASRWLLPDRRRSAIAPVARAADEPRRARRMLVHLFLVGMAIALAELPPHDWSALLLRDRFDVTAGQAGLGFVAVATGMLVGRLGGDHATDRFGLERTRRGGAALAALGIVVATLAPTPIAAGGGLLLTGIGLASLFPLLFRAASDLTHGSHSGMAAFSSGARMGFLCASPLMGLIAEAAGVAPALLVVAGTAATTVAVSRLPRPALTVTPPA